MFKVNESKQARRGDKSFKLRKGPDGLHAFFRSTGLNVLLDEYSVPQEEWSSAPQFVSIALTNTCDLACSYCYAPKHRAFLDYPKLINWICELDSAGCFGVGFGGGEPTLYQNLPELLKQVHDETQLAATFTTHGQHISQRYAESIEGLVQFIRVSMDGVGEVYERLRGASYRSLITNLSYIRAVSSFGINYVVNEATFSCIDEALQTAIACGASQFVLLPERRTQRTDGIDATLLSRLTKWVNRNKSRVNLAISTGSLRANFFCEPLPRENGFRAYAHIDADGLLKANSFSDCGVEITDTGVLAAIEEANH